MLQPFLLKQYLDVLPALGLDEGFFASDAGIAPQSIGDPAYLIAFEQYLRLFEQLARCNSVPGLGLEFGLRTTLADSGVLGDATLFCRSVRESMEMLWARFGVVMGMMACPRFDDGESRTVTIEFGLPPLSRAAYRMCIEDALTRVASTGTAVTVDKAVFEKLFVAYPAPEYRTRYEAIFQCPIVFNAPYTRAVVRRDWIERPLKTQDQARLASYLRGLADLHRSVRERSPMADRIEERLLRWEDRALPSQSAMAAEMALSRRSFCRSLQNCGSSYRDLLESVRIARAKLSLDFDAATAKEAGYRAGYDNPSAFRRAFKKSTGLTVREYCARRKTIAESIKLN